MTDAKNSPADKIVGSTDGLEAATAMMTNNELAAAISFAFDVCDKCYIGGHRSSESAAGKEVLEHLKKLLAVQLVRSEAGESERLRIETEILERQLAAKSAEIAADDRNVNNLMDQVHEMSKELDKYTRRSESGESLGDAIDLAEEIERLRAANKDLQSWFDNLKTEFDLHIDLVFEEET